MFPLLFSPCPSKVIISYLQVVSKIISNFVRHSAQMTKDFLTLLLPALLLNIMSLCVDYVFHDFKPNVFLSSPPTQSMNTY